MPCWFYDKKALHNTPSIQDGIDYKTECQYRKQGAQLIIQIGSQMELGYNTLATGVVYFHRFYMFHSFNTFSPYITACCCLFLAGKAEETPKKSKDIIKIAKKFLGKDKFLSLGTDPREEVMTMEKILLQTLKFDLKVRHPYCYLLRYVKCLRGDKRRMQKMVQMAWTFINDSLCTTLSVQWEPEIIAIAVMYLAEKLVRFKILGWSHRKPSHKHWWELFVEDLGLDVIEEICHDVLDLYSPLSRYMPDSPKPVIKPQIKVSETRRSEHDSIDFKPQVEASETRRSECKSIDIKPQVKAAETSRAEPVTVNTNTSDKVSPKDSTRIQKFNDASKVIPTPVSISRDPRLENGSIFAKAHFETNPLNTSALVPPAAVVSDNMKFTPSPAIPTGSYPLTQSLQSKPQGSTMSNFSHEPQEDFSFPSFMAKFETSSESLPLEKLQDPIMRAVVDNISNWEPRVFQKSADSNKQDDNNDKPLKLKRGFGCSNNDDQDHNKPMGFRGGFRNNNRNNRGYGHNNFRRRNFENNNYDNSDNHNENRGFGNRNRYNNRRYNENRFRGSQDWENKNEGNNMQNDGKLFENRGFGNASSGYADHSSNDNDKTVIDRDFGNANNNNNMNSDNKPLTLTRGFGNSNNRNNSCNGNNSRPRLNYNRGNRFERSDPYPRKFNNNYENDRYSNNFTNRGGSKGFMRDAPGKIVDNQRFYHPPKENNNEKVAEEESWD